nr:hypothetical protein [Arenimonas daejeonensis]
MPPRCSSASAKAAITLRIVPSFGSECRAGRFGAGANGAREGFGFESTRRADGLGHAGQELRQDGARIAARPVHRILADPAQQVARAPVRRLSAPASTPPR